MVWEWPQEILVTPESSLINFGIKEGLSVPWPSLPPTPHPQLYTFPDAFYNKKINKSERKEEEKQKGRKIQKGRRKKGGRRRIEERRRGDWLIKRNKERNQEKRMRMNYS